MDITREKAICMLFCQEYNEYNVKELDERIRRLGGIDIYYATDPTEPVLLPLAKIYSNPYKYQQYVSTKAEETEKPDTNPKALPTGQRRF
jgi:hypothetical protein